MAGLLLSLAIGRANAQDITPPSVKITAPPAHTQLDSPELILEGHATDNTGVMDLVLLLNGDTVHVPADMDWIVDVGSSGLMLLPGTNTIFVTAIDFDGNKSKPAQRDFFFAVPSTVTVNTNGNGSAVGPKETVPTYIGRGYRFVAKPMPGNIFDYWSDDATGQVLGSNAVLNLVLSADNVSLTANFVTNLFNRFKGTYQGLASDGSAFYSIIDYTKESADVGDYPVSGYITATTTSHGAYSGRLFFGDDVYSFTGKFGEFMDTGDGSAFSISHVDRVINTSTTLAIDLTLTVATNAATKRLEAVLSGSAGLNHDVETEMLSDAYQAAASFSATLVRPLKRPLADRYTLAVAPVTPEVEATGKSGPNGYSYGGALADRNGNVSIFMYMADSVGVVSFSTVMDKDGTFPLFAPLYKSKSVITNGGFITGKIKTANPQKVITGAINWVKPPSSSPYYPEGFNATPNGFAEGVAYNAARYVAPALGQNVFHWNAGVFKVDPYYKTQLTYNPKNNEFSIFDGNPFNIKLSFYRSNGQLLGSFVAAGKTNVIRGTILAKSDFSPVPALVGFYLDSNQSVPVYIGK